MPKAEGSARISPTAHYTSYVWYRNGLSHPELATPLGRLMYGAMASTRAVLGPVIGWPDLEIDLLARHGTIDDVLDEAIAEGRIDQVLELAAGLSGRGLRVTSRHPGVRYIESDLPAMAERKRRALAAAGRGGGEHRVVALDALSDGGPESLAAVASRWLDPARGAAIITEGLLMYLDAASVLALWRRIAATLSAFPSGVYLSEIGFLRTAPAGVHAFRRVLSVFARGQVTAHFDGEAAAAAALREAGFAGVKLVAPRLPARASRPTFHFRIASATTGTAP